MEYRKLGETDLECSVITFGAWAIGGWKWGGSDRNEAVKAIRAAYSEGVTSIDTAPAYGQGLSEEIVAEALETIPRDKVQILTKFGLRWDTKEGEFYFKDILLADDNTPETAYMKELFWEQLTIALQELPENQRQVFVWNELEDQTFQEISDRTGENIKTLISRKRYAVRHLRERLESIYREFVNY